MSRVITQNVNSDPLVCGEFRRGRGYTNWRPKGSGDWLLIVGAGGAGRVSFERGGLRLAAGDAVLFAPGARQDYETDSDLGSWHLRWAHFKPRPNWRAWLMWPQVAPQTGAVNLRGPVEAAVGGALERMLAAHRLGGPACNDLAMNALEEALLWIFRLVADRSLAEVDERIQRAIYHLVTHSSEPFGLDALAERCGLSSSRFSHLFRAEMGTTPQRFAEKLRMETARQLLAQTNLSVAEIGAEVGYEDPLYFSRRFRLFYGKPPSDERLNFSTLLGKIQFPNSNAPKARAT